MARRFPLAAKFFLTHAVVAVLALGIAGTAGYLQFREYAYREADRGLLQQALIAAEAFRPLLSGPSPDRDRIAAEGDRIGRNLESRLTVILPDGTVVADSATGAGGVPGMENHGERPEMRAALSGNPGYDTHWSVYAGEEQRYCAVPVVSDGRVAGAVRVSLSYSSIRTRLGRMRSIAVAAGVVALLLMLAGSMVGARRMGGPLAEIRAASRDLAAGMLSRRANVRTGDELEDAAAALNRTAAHLEETIRNLTAESVRLSTLLESLSEGVLVLGDDRTIRRMNREAAALLDAAGVRAVGRPYGEVIRTPEVLRFLDDLRGREAGRHSARDVLLHGRAGDRTVRVAGTRVRYEGEKGTDFLVTLRDITEEKRLARIKSDFVSNASHELRTPLTTIRGYLEAVRDALEEGTPADPEFVSVALANALRMETLISDLLELSRIESGRTPLELSEVPLSSLLRHVASLHREPADRGGKTILVESDDASVRADVPKLSLAVGNLVDNALKHGREGGTVRVAGRVSGGMTEIEVSDDGPGIPAESLPRIFERFYRGDPGRSRDLGGTGLGLSIAKHVVEAHGGTIAAESRLGVGSTFRIRIPSRPAE